MSVQRSENFFAYGEPGHDTTILLGYVKDLDHWEWIRERRTYNVRAQGRRGGVSIGADLLYSQLLRLYCPSLDLIRLARIVSRPELVAADAMRAVGYPNPRGEYLCVQIADLSESPATLVTKAAKVSAFAREQSGTLGEPVSVSWGALLRGPVGTDPPA